MRARTAIFAMLALLAPLGGCTGMVIKGKVIPGELGRVVRVSDSDDRLEADGLGEITVVVSQGGTPGRSVAELGKAVSKPDGSFRMDIPNEKLRSGRIRVHVEAESVFRVQNMVDFPREGESLLVQVIRRVVTPEPEAQDAPEKEPE